MKKIFLMLVAVCAFAACDPIHEKIGNAGHITLEELKAKTTVTVDKAASGLNGNVITCSTSAPVNAKWTMGGKSFTSNYAWKKMKLGDHVVTLTALSILFLVRKSLIHWLSTISMVIPLRLLRSPHSYLVHGTLLLCVSAQLKVLTCQLFPMTFTSV